MKEQIYSLTRNGNVIFQGTNDSCYYKLQRVQSNSSIHAIRYEGYKIEKFECTELQAKEILKNDPWFDVDCELLADLSFWGGSSQIKVRVLETGEIKSANKNAMKYSNSSKGSIVKVSQSYLS